VTEVLSRFDFLVDSIAEPRKDKAGMSADQEKHYEIITVKFLTFHNIFSLFVDVVLLICT
jgi:hypothetical protein